MKLLISSVVRFKVGPTPIQIASSAADFYLVQSVDISLPSDFRFLLPLGRYYLLGPLGKVWTEQKWAGHSKTPWIYQHRLVEIIKIKETIQPRTPTKSPVLPFDISVMVHTAMPNRVEPGKSCGESRIFPVTRKDSNIPRITLLSSFTPPDYNQLVQQCVRMQRMKSTISLTFLS